MKEKSISMIHLIQDNDKNINLGNEIPSVKKINIGQEAKGIVPPTTSAVLNNNNSDEKKKE